MQLRPPCCFLLALCACYTTSLSEKTVEASDNDVHPRTERALSSFIRIGKDGQSQNIDDSSPEKRMSHFVRIGKSSVDDSLPEVHDFVPHLPDDSIAEKRMSSFVRIGKRPSSFVRIGKNVLPISADKKLSTFVRIGKGLSQFMRIGKRYGSSFVRIGRNLINEPLTKRRTSSFVRIGKSSEGGLDPETVGTSEDSPREGENFNGLDKRMSSFVRIGKSFISPAKRMSSFVRIGRGFDDGNTDSLDDTLNETDDNMDEQEKRGSSFVRIGRSANDFGDLSDLDTRDKRQFLRIGKIPSSAFMRIGRRPIFRLGRVGHSSFIRIGKRSKRSTSETSPDAEGEKNLFHIIKNPGEFVSLLKTYDDQEGTEKQHM